MTIGHQFIPFLAGPTQPSQKRLHVSINHKGIIYLNNNIFRELGRPPAVELRFDPQHERIAVMPCNPRLNQAFPVKNFASQHLIHASPFCRHFGIKLDSTEKFIDPEINGGILYLDLKATVRVNVIDRKRKKRG